MDLRAGDKKIPDAEKVESKSKAKGKGISRVRVPERARGSACVDDMSITFSFPIRFRYFNWSFRSIKFLIMVVGRAWES